MEWRRHETAKLKLTFLKNCKIPSKGQRDKTWWSFYFALWGGFIYYLFDKILNLLWQKNCTIGQTFVVANGPILNIWSSHLVTLVPKALCWCKLIFFIGLFTASFCFTFVFSIQLIVNKICQSLVSNRGSLVRESTALPVEPQPLPTTPTVVGFVTGFFLRKRRDFTRSSRTCKNFPHGGVLRN